MNKQLAQNGSASDWSFHVATRSSNPSLWQDVYEQLDVKPYHLKYEVMTFFQQSLEGDGVHCVDHSLILFEQGHPCGLWSLQSLTSSNEKRLLSNGLPVAQPEFLASVTTNTKRKIIRALLTDIQRVFVSEGYSVTLCSRSSPWAGSPFLDEWFQEISCFEQRPLLRQNMALGLLEPFPQIRKGFRKSYRPLINKGLSMWDNFQLDHDNPDPSAWREFQDFHVETAGRVTRSQASWNSQFEFIRRGFAFLIGLRDEEGRLIGAGLFTHSPDECVYSSGVYDRKLFKFPLGHVVQSLAIEEMQRRRLRWYSIGERLYAFDLDRVTEKELSISHFKAGFANKVVPSFEVILSP